MLCDGESSHSCEVTNMNGRRFSLILISITAYCCASATTLRAAGNADRFLETAKALIQAINSDDSAAIQAIFNASMQQALPPEKAMPFFRGLITAKGKLKPADRRVAQASPSSCEP